MTACWGSWNWPANTGICPIFPPPSTMRPSGRWRRRRKNSISRKSVNVRPARNLGWTAGGVMLCLLTVWLAVPQAGWNAFLRWVQPAAQVERYTLVVLDGFAPEMIVPHGEPFAISGTVRYRSFWKPSRFLHGSGGKRKWKPPRSRAGCACKYPDRWRRAF